MIELLRNLMKKESVTPDKVNETVEFAAAYLKERGIEGQILERAGLKSYVALIGKGEATLIFNGHLDVVSGRPEQFIPEEKDGRIYGRGSADMKGGCAAMIEAFIKLSREELPCRIMLQLVPDEETGGRHGTAHLIDRGFTGDFAICTEPTNLEISLKAKGIINMYIENSGVSAHGSRPWEGENAILQAYDDFRRIEELPILNESSPYYEKSSVNLGKIEGGDILNRVPDSCLMGLDIRYVPHLSAEDVIDEIKKVVRGKVTIERTEPAVDTPGDHPYVERLKESIRKETGEIPPLAAAHGGSDARFFASRNIPAVDLGPCGAGWHGDGEYVEKDSLFQLERILIDFALSFNKY
ncbi:MAG: M20/M25/M40 family metallo-hydrolase [Spirochaetales bacterium]|nr:M20/M25/M40 family metallo-hydrolase [Spirochaetales bacterium]